MGGLLSRNTTTNQVVEISTNNAYHYPPKTGNYFSNYFIMGGERFDTPQPESYLFGENDDLNFIGNKPSAFPYQTPQGNEPTKMLKSLVNIRKSSLRFVRTAEPTGKAGDAPGLIEDHLTRYNVEFTFDADIKCAITIYYFATEDIINGRIIYTPRDPAMNSETYSYKQGANQVFSQTSHIINPSQFAQQDWQYDHETGVIPVVIQCVVEDEEHNGHSHMTLATVDHCAEFGYVLKPLKQKQFVNGVPFLLQEIYGIENKPVEKSKDPDDDIDETGAECIICMSELRDTLILPCRHLCLCSTCAESLRYQSSSCPICRSNFRALLQLRAMRRTLAVFPSRDTERNETVVSQGNMLMVVPLFEALNGPSVVPNQTQDTNRTARTDASKADRKRSLKKLHSVETRANENPVTVTTEVETIQAESMSVRSPTHSARKPHPSHNRHLNRSAEKRINKTQISEDKDSPEKATISDQVFTPSHSIDESDPTADDADDEQSSDDDGTDQARHKTASPRPKKPVLASDLSLDSTSTPYVESFEMIAVSDTHEDVTCNANSDPSLESSQQVSQPDSSPMSDGAKGSTLTTDTTTTHVSNSDTSDKRTATGFSTTEAKKSP